MTDHVQLMSEILEEHRLGKEKFRIAKFEYLDDGMLVKLHFLQGGTTDFTQFKNRIFELLHRYEFYEEQFLENQKLSGNIVLKKLERALIKSSNLIVELPDEIRKDIESNFDLRRLEKLYFNSDPANRVKIPHPEPIYVELSKIIDAVQDVIESNAGQKGRPATNTVLTQFILDLGATFQNDSGLNPRKHCHLDRTTDQYKGLFFDYVETLLLAYVPEKIHSNGALGKTIERALKLEFSSQT